jgi:hypothetical protein
MFRSLTCEERLAGFTLVFEQNFAEAVGDQEKYLCSVGSWRHDGKVCE